MSGGPPVPPRPKSVNEPPARELAAPKASLLAQIPLRFREDPDDNLAFTSLTSFDDDGSDDGSPGESVQYIQNAGAQPFAEVSEPSARDVRSKSSVECGASPTSAADVEERGDDSDSAGNAMFDLEELLPLTRVPTRRLGFEPQWPSPPSSTSQSQQAGRSHSNAAQVAAGETVPEVSASEALYALATLWSIPGSVKHEPRNRQLRAYDRIAFLFATDGDGDEAAISINITMPTTPEQRRKMPKTGKHIEYVIEVLYAKNRPATDWEKEYYNDMLEELLAVNELNRDAVETTILNLVMANCRAKILDLHYDLRVALRQHNPIERIVKTLNREDSMNLRQRLIAYAKSRTTPVMTVEDSFIAWLNEITHEDAVSELFVLECWCFGLNITELMTDLNIANKIWRLTTYVQAIQYMVRAVIKFQPTEITLTEILSPQPPEIVTYPSVMSILEKHAIHDEHSMHLTAENVIHCYHGMTIEDLTLGDDLAVYNLPKLDRKAGKGKAKDINIDPTALGKRLDVFCCQHAEVTLICEFVRRSQTNQGMPGICRTYPIGYSSDSCFACERFSVMVNNTQREIFVSQLPGGSRIEAGWLGPEDQGKPIIDALGLLNKHLKTLFDIRYKDLSKRQVRYDEKQQRARRRRMAEKRALPTLLPTIGEEMEKLAVGEDVDAVSNTDSRADKGKGKAREALPTIEAGMERLTVGGEVDMVSTVIERWKAVSHETVREA